MPTAVSKQVLVPFGAWVQKITGQLITGPNQHAASHYSIITTIILVVSGPGEWFTNQLRNFRILYAMQP